MTTVPFSFNRKFLPIAFLRDWPEHVYALPFGRKVLLNAGLETVESVFDPSRGEIRVSGKLLVIGEIAVNLPFDVAVLTLNATDGFTEIDFEVAITEELGRLRLPSIRPGLRFATDLLTSVQKKGDEWVPVTRLDGSPAPYQIDLEGLSLELDTDGNVDFGFSDSAPSVALKPVMLGETGIVIESPSIRFYFDEHAPPPPGQSAGFRGVYIQEAAIHFPPTFVIPDAALRFRDCFIGSGGFTGTAVADWTADPLSGSLFGMDVALKSASVQLRQNALVGCAFKATIDLPFFDQPADIIVGFDLNGRFYARLSAKDGLLELTKPGVFRIELDSIAFEVDDGVFTTKLSGKLTPLFGNPGLKWPTFDIKDLSIDSKGNVKLPGGWLSLAKQKTFDFYGFKIEIAQIGFGKNENGSKWVGFSGGLKLVDGLQAGASVEGLRITWFEDDLANAKITLNGAGVELKIPGVLQLKGSVSYREMTLNGEDIKRFDGDIKLKIETPEMAVDGMMVIGSAKGPQGRYNFFAIYVDVELPTAITLGSTGLAIYNIAGLFALQMEPNKKADEQWFSIEHDKSFYHRNPPGITDLRNKWDPRKGSFAVGAGITLGTYADNGYTFNGKFLLAIVIPGPIVLFQGASSFLTKRADGGSEGQFRSLAVYDGRAGSFLIGLDAEYKTGKGGELIEIGGSLEAYYSLHDPTAWHLWLGKRDPQSLRIRALFGKFVEANAYFMLDARQLALGAWFGYANSWGFGPLSVRLEAWAEGNALISFKPTHFHGDLWMHALVELNAFGIGFGIALDARIEADLFKPFHLRGEFSVGIKLPWPIKKKVGGTVVLEWGPRLLAPPLPLPLTQAAIEHLKSTVVWPLPRGKYLLPSYDDGGGFVAGPSGSAQPANLATVPAVPLDSRISLTFARSVHDGAQVGINPQPVDPAEEGIGHPGGPVVARVKYVLEALELSRLRPNGTWQLVAKSPKTDPTPALFGSWMPVPSLPGPSPAKPGQTKLLLWSKSAFDFTRATGSSWEEWVSDTWPDYPCIPLVPAEESCFGFGEWKHGTELKSPWTYPGPPRVTLSWGFGPATVTEHSAVGVGQPRNSNWLCFPALATRRGVRIECEPGQSVKIFLAPGAVMTQRQVIDGTFRLPSGSPPAVVCVDVRNEIAGTRANPWLQDRVRFTVRDREGTLLPQARIERWEKSPLGLNAGFHLAIELPCASPWVELIVTHRPPFRIVAFNGAGTAVATHPPGPPGVQTTETIRLEGEGITRVEVEAGGNEKLIHSVCYVCSRPSGPSGTGHDGDGNSYGPFHPVDGTIEVIGDDITDVVLTSDDGFCIEKICVTPDPDAGQVVGREEMIEHIRQELARWQSEGAVLEPHTTYRLTVRTLVHPTPVANISLSDVQPVEHAYFRTEGPPGITRLLPPEGVAPETFDSGLEDLVRYVRETDPPTVPPPGEKPILYEPFYRAYDLGAEFNETYVEQMYRMDGRDLGLYVYDNSNQPARDARGRLLALANRWGVAETLTLSEKDTRWITQIDNATCLGEKLDPETFPRSSALASSDPGRVLAPDTLHEARLIPLLLHETFSRAPLAGVPPGWLAEDSGAGGPSQWQVGELGEPATRFVEQASAIGGTLLLLGASSGWTDYRVSVYVRSPIRGAIGVVVRHQGGGTGYCFSMDATHRRLMSGTTVLREEHFAYQKDRDYWLTVEVLGDMVRTYVDGEPVFEVEDAAFTHGRIGLYVSQSAGARFSDVTVDDLRREAPVVYRFGFTTSRYANFFHHIHSFEDEVWPADLGTQDVTPQLAEVVGPGLEPPSEREARAYDELATAVLGQASRQDPERTELTRIARTGAGSLYLLRSPEPIDPRRTLLSAWRSMGTLPAGDAPGALKLTDAALDRTHAAEESITLLLREAVELTRHRIELRSLPGLVAEQVGDPVLFVETFQRPESAERFTIADAVGPSLWQWESGALVETSGIGGGNEPELPGTHAVIGDAAGDPEWQDYRVTADLRADAGGEIGLMFRYRDAGNYYRLSLGAARSYRRLVKCVAGLTTVLWDESEGHAAGERFRVVVEAVGTRLSAFVDDAKIFEVADDAHGAGGVGIYAASNPGARCELLEVRLPSVEARALLADAFDRGEIAGWTLTSEVTGVPLDQAARMSVADGMLWLESLVAEGGSPEYPGAYALTGDPAWSDVILQARVCASAGVVGVVIRASSASHYRFSLGTAGERMLVKKAGGSTTILWRDAGAFLPDRTYEITLSAIGRTLRGFIDGVPLFALDDADLATGQAGLFAWSATAARFSDVRVWPGTQAFSDWALEEHFAALDADRWTFVGETGDAESDHWNVQDGVLQPIVTSSEIPMFPSEVFLPPVTFGAHYAIAARPEIGECRILARLRLDPAADAGIVFGWRDVSNHTVLWLGRGMVRLVRTAGGNAETLASLAVPIDYAGEHVVTIDCIDGRITGSVDGGRMFGFELPATTGRVGFAVFALPTFIVVPQARFGELLVAEPRWTTLHAFPPEERVPAGTRVQVYAANPPVTPSEAGLVVRSIAGVGERGRMRLRGALAMLRLVGPDGRPGHVRGFLSEATWVPIGMQRLRKADGTGCLLMPDDGQNTNPLRLELTFLRDRPDAGRTMSQAGDRGPEQVTIVLR